MVSGMKDEHELIYKKSCNLGDYLWIGVDIGLKWRICLCIALELLSPQKPGEACSRSGGPMAPSENLCQ